MPFATSGGGSVSGAQIVDDTISADDINPTALQGFGVAAVGNTQVFSGSAVGSWTDLDLSGTVGAKAVVVMLRITKTSANASGTNYAVRRNGDTPDMGLTSGDDPGNAGYTGILSNGQSGRLLCATDSAGVIEWIASATNDTCTIHLEAYW